MRGDSYYGRSRLVGRKNLEILLTKYTLECHSRGQGFDPTQLHQYIKGLMAFRLQALFLFRIICHYVAIFVGSSGKNSLHCLIALPPFQISVLGVGGRGLKSSRPDQ